MQLVGSRTCISYRGVPSDDEIFRQGWAGEDDGRGCGGTGDKQRVQQGSDGDCVAAGVAELTSSIEISCGHDPPQSWTHQKNQPSPPDLELRNQS